MSEPSFENVETDHEYDGIREFDNPLPRWWLATFALTVIFSVFYWLGTHSLQAAGTFEVYAAEQKAYDNELLAKAISEDQLLALVADPAALEAGKQVFDQFCVTCHLERGEGKIGPNLTDKYWIHKGGPKDIWLSVMLGQTQRGMPAWRALGPTKVEQVTAYVMSIQNTNVPGKAPQGEEWAP